MTRWTGCASGRMSTSWTLALTSTCRSGMGRAPDYDGAVGWLLAAGQ